jgi:hypothetical protein
MRDTKLKQFVDRIFSISVPTMSFLGGAIPMNGSTGATGGAFTSSGDVTYKLKGLTADFANAYESSKATQPDLLKQAKEIEGFILSEETLSVLTQDQANSLLDQLYDLIDAKGIQLKD